MKDVLENVDIRTYRAAGNTTRVIDNAVQILFDVGEVTIRDHFKTDDKRTARIVNEGVFYKFLKRLEFEHNLSYFTKSGIITIDRDSLTVKINNYPKERKMDTYKMVEYEPKEKDNNEKRN